MEKDEKTLKAETIDDDSPDLETYDALETKKKRMHCWVLLKQGERQLSESFFVEPTTGRRYDLADAPYQTIQCIFNHKNFWINLDHERAIKDLNMDFEDGQEWEYVMLSDEEKDKGEDDDDMDDDAESGDEEE